ncbi:MAG: mechanosensitive ion channel family protein [Verrucomicrobia bacterium]|nr:mechanosensitive ion channel family protein [Verrucomicrobiota bacterium]
MEMLAVALAELAPSRSDSAFAAAERWLAENGLALVRNLTVALLIVWIGRLLARWLRNFLLRWGADQNRRHRLDPTMARYLGSLGGGLLQALAIFTALGQLGIPNAQFAAVVGAAGLAVGLALQGNLSNFAAGVIIVALRPFERGDLIGTVGGLEGVVDETQAFSTLLNTADGRRVIVPNATLTSNPLVNFTVRGQRSIVLRFPAPRRTDVGSLRASLLDELKAYDGVVANPPPSLSVREFNADAVTLELNVWVRPERYGEVQARLNEVLAGIDPKG